MRHFLKSACRTALVSSLAISAFALAPAPSFAQGVPVIDSTSILKEVDQLNVMLKNVGIQTDLLTQAKQQFEKLQQQLSQLQDIYKQFNGLRNIASLDLPGELNGILKGNMNGILSTLTAGANGDWSGITSGKSSAMKATIDKSLKSAGLSQDLVSQWSSSPVAAQQRTAQQATNGAMLAATGEQTYTEAGQSLDRVKAILDDSKNSPDIKASIDNNTRMLAELSVQLAKSLEVTSVQAVTDGQAEVFMSADKAEQEKFFTFSNGTN